MKGLFAGVAILAGVSAAQADDFIFKKVTPIVDAGNVPDGDYANFVLMDENGNEFTPEQDKAEGKVWRAAVSCSDIFQSKGVGSINEILRLEGFDEAYTKRLEGKVNTALRAAERVCARGLTS